MFSGYNSWVNDVKIKGVVDNCSNKDLTKAVLQEINQEKEEVGKEMQRANTIVPCIGHMWAIHTPDRTNVSFELQYKANKTDSGYSKTYVRSNTETFVSAAKHILNLLLSCLKKDSITEAEWTPFAKRLEQAFLFVYPFQNKEKTLSVHWHTVFPEYDYSYSKKSMEATFYEKKQGGSEANNILGTNYTQEFYQYNYIADSLLIEMYGVHPRKAWWN